MSDASPNLIVLRTADLNAALTFYRAIGIEFAQEQHGSGPIHYAAKLGGMVLELYPGEPGSAPDRKQGGTTMLGFRVKSVDDVLAVLNQQPLSPAKDTAWGRRALVLDPDGRAVEITQPLAEAD